MRDEYDFSSKGPLARSAKRPAAESLQSTDEKLDTIIRLLREIAGVLKKIEQRS